MEIHPKKRILFVINPISNRYSRYDLPEKIHQLIDRSIYTYDVMFTDYAGHATSLAKEAAQKGFFAVIAVGGDGSVNEIAEALINSQTALGIIPIGSGNGLSNCLGYRARNVGHALKTINQGKSKLIDSVLCNNHYAFSNAGTGFDASVARRFKHHKLRGFFSYAAAVIKEYFSGVECKSLTIKLDGTKKTANTFMFNAFNSNQFGYKVGPFKDAKIDDGALNILWVKEFPRWQLIWYIFALLVKKPNWLKQVECCEVKQLEIEAENKRVIQLDGDPHIIHDKLVMQIKPLSLKVLIPQ